MIAQPAEKQLSNDGASEGERRDVLLGGGVFVPVAIDLDEYRIDLSDDSWERLICGGISRPRKV